MPLRTQKPRKVRKGLKRKNYSARVVSHQPDAVTSLGDALEMLDVLSHLSLSLSLSIYIYIYIYLVNGMGCGV
jgi:hypothetical protein